MKKNIFIIGYPKSGTTWLARLLAEIIACPCKGYWGKRRTNRDEYATEGLKRKSEFRVWKGHHSVEILKKPSRAYKESKINRRNPKVEVNKYQIVCLYC